MKKGTLSRRTRINSKFHYCLVSLLSLAILFPYLFLPLPASARVAKAERLNSSNSSSESSPKIQPLAALPAPKPAPLSKSVAQPQAAPMVAGPGRLIFGVGGVRNGLLMTNTDGTNAVNLTDSGAAVIQHPSVSAQTGMVAFDAQNIQITPPLPEKDRRIFVMNGDGSGVRQITFVPDQANPLFTQDSNPEISPDGTKVAFISARTAGQIHQCTMVNQTATTTNEVFVVNVDGTNLRQVTHPKFLDDPNFGCDISNNYAVAWSSDSQQLAVLGRRQYTFTKINVGVSHMYNSISIDDADTGIAYNFGSLDGGDKEPVKKARIATGGFIDWSPSNTILFEANLGGVSGENGVSVGYLRSESGPAICGVDGGGGGGGGGGGFADCTAAQTLMGEIGFGGSTDGQPHGGQIFAEPGSLRYSPDGSMLLIAGVSPLANNGLIPTVFVGNGSGLIPASQNSGWLHSGIAWAPGPTIPTPDKLVLTPAPLALYDGKSQQVIPTLLDAQGNVIAHSALWRQSDACPTCGSRCDNTPDEIGCSVYGLGSNDIDFTGTVFRETYGPIGYGNLCAQNAGLRSCVPFFNADSIPVVTVAATTPVASVDNQTNGVFTITRSGSPTALNVSAPLQIPFTISGSATQGTDFISVGQVASIPAGQVSTTVQVVPLLNPLNLNTKTVTLAFDGGSTSNYFVGFPADKATVTIAATTNISPTLGLTKITPNKGGDGGVVAVTLFGQGLKSGANLTLGRSGSPSIFADVTQVAQSGTSLNAVFNLIGATQGTYDVIVTNPDGATSSLPAAFTVEKNREAQIWTEVLGRTTIRSNRDASFEILYGNSGNVDAYAVPLFITGIPPGAIVHLDSALTPLNLPVMSNGFDPNQGSPEINTGTEQIVPLLIRRVAPGSIGYVRVTIFVPGVYTDLGFELNAIAWKPLLKAVTPSQTAVAQNLSGTRVHGPAADSFDPMMPPPSLVDYVPNDDVLTCLNDLLQAVSNCLGALLPTGCLQNSASILMSAASTFVTGTADPPSGASALASFKVAAASAANTIGICAYEVAGKEFPPAQAINLLICGIGFVSAAKNCAEAAGRLSVQVRRSRDPNEKVGAQGFGPEHYISSSEPLRYGIYFENQETATAPAQDVVITDHLDPTRVDLSTFSLGDISFGTTLVSVPPGQAGYNTDVDLRPAANLIVRIQASLDSSTGVVTWRFTSTDPATGQPPTDPLAGFLPPNTDANAPAGEGGVLFTVNAKTNLPTGTQVTNTARIVFDQNAPMDTNTFTNTLDNSEPLSNVLPITANACTPSFSVQWSGTDTGSGIAAYSIFVSDNGGPFTVWQTGTTATAAVFGGQAGHTYGFYSMARDNAGNTEDPHSTADATVTVVSPQPPTISCPINISVSDDSGQCSARVALPIVNGSDVCDGNLTATGVRSDGKPLTDPYPTGTTTLTWTVKNSNGLSASCPQTITVKDTELPRISCPAPITVEFASNSGAAVTVSAPNATDNCGARVTGVRSDGQPLSALYPIGTTTITWTATDGAGNKASCAQMITVLGALGTMQDVLNDLNALRATIIIKQDRDALDDAISELKETLNAKLWIDQTHVQCKTDGGVFDESEEVIAILRNLIKNKKSKIAGATLQGFINRIVNADRLLALSAINTAVAAGGNAKDIAKAQDLLAEGDRDITAGRYEGIDDYGSAWKSMMKSRC